MGYAIQNDGAGWRAVNGVSEVGANETYSETQPPIIAPVPFLSDLDFRLALNWKGWRADVEAYVAGSGDQNIIDFYDRAPTFYLNDPMVEAARVALGKSNAQMKSLFTYTRPV